MWLELLQSLAGVLLLGALSTALALHGWHRNTFLASTGGGSADGAPLPLQGRRIGLVIAHPDDESMFFVPTLSHLREEGSHAVHILCLSTGNADGLGTTRTAELRAAASLLGVPPARLRIVDDQTNLADGMRSRWSVKVARGHIERFVDDHRIDTLLTFDSEGVSGHPNHIATFHAVQSFLQMRGAESGVEAFSLESTPMWRKYAGLLDGARSWRDEWDDEQRDGRATHHRRRLYFISSLTPLLSHRAMAAHASQFVWYRRLFVIFSRYTFLNTLVRMDVDAPPSAGDNGSTLPPDRPRAIATGPAHKTT